MKIPLLFTKKSIQWRSKFIYKIKGNLFLIREVSEIFFTHNLKVKFVIESRTDLFNNHIGEIDLNGLIAVASSTRSMKIRRWNPWSETLFTVFVNYSSGS